MNYLLALLSAAAGIAVFVWHKSSSQMYAEFMAKRFKEYYGSFTTKMKWDDPNTWQSFSYRLGLIGAGLFFIAVAFSLVFGTIQVGGA
jgi:hypothetical protein